jgi:hypothetical protein
VTVSRWRPLPVLTPVIAIAAIVAACADELPAPAWRITRTAVLPLSSLPSPSWSAADVATAPRFDGRLAVLQASVDGGGALTVWLLVTGEMAGRTKPALVVGWPGHATRAVPLTAWLTPLEWRLGDVVELTVPQMAPSTSSRVVRVGIEDAGRRWSVQGGGRAVHDGLVDLTVAVPVGMLGEDPVGATDDPPGTLEVRRRTGPILIDGVLDEPDWQRAPSFTLLPWKAGAPVTLATSVRLLWDETSLYLAFDVDDDDPHSPYSRRDDPLYESEALEIFIDADGDSDVYVELQCSPSNVHFDAAFSGGPRQHMDTAWDAPFITATLPRDDGGVPGYRQEWRIPVAALKGIPVGEPRAGARWRANVFRLERRRQRDRVTSTEASALSPPERGDFHALDRFGTLRFTDRH